MDFVFLVNLEGQIASDYERKGGSEIRRRAGVIRGVHVRTTGGPGNLLPTCAPLLTPGGCEECASASCLLCDFVV